MLENVGIFLKNNNLNNINHIVKLYKNNLLYERFLYNDIININNQINIKSITQLLLQNNYCMINNIRPSKIDLYNKNFNNEVFKTYLQLNTNKSEQNLHKINMFNKEEKKSVR